MINIDFNSVINAFVSGTLTVRQNFMLWGGKVVEIIKSGSVAALPYLKDKRIAAVSLIAVNLILIGLGELFSRVLLYPFPEKTEGQKSIKGILSFTIGLGTTVIGVIAFSKSTNLPLSPSVITTISVATVVFFAYMADKRSNTAPGTIEAKAKV